jgi:hypothetical protein
MASPEAEEGQDRQNNHDKTDEIDEAVHEIPPCARPMPTHNLPRPAKFQNREKLAISVGSVIWRPELLRCKEFAPEGAIVAEIRHHANCNAERQRRVGGSSE